MKPRKTKDIQKVLQKKGFVLEPEKDHHQFFYLVIDGKKQAIKTYLSHGKDEYGDTLMSEIKKQLKFKETKKAEDFFDCPLTKEKYIEMLKELGEIKNNESNIQILTSTPEPSPKRKNQGKHKKNN